MIWYQRISVSRGSIKLSFRAIVCSVRLGICDILTRKGGDMERVVEEGKLNVG